MTERITEEFLKYKRVIASLLSKIRPTATPQDIEDILQDTYINTYQSARKQEIIFPKAFMVKTAIRLANRSAQLAQRIESDSEIEERPDDAGFRYDLGQFASQTERDVINREDFGLLCAAVDGLPEQCRKVFVLKKIYGLSQKEIASELDISESTVEKHVAKGLLRTMQYYDAQNAELNLNVNTHVTSLTEYKKMKQKVK
ncbi:MAG: RNA polymerase sigma factor [Acidiferrobacterales bacterium]|nr:RNA polymerase sigma factor [Acidiferrobacterales bacterium]